jgi:hypothetical protein
MKQWHINSNFNLILKAHQNKQTQLLQDQDNKKTASKYQLNGPLMNKRRGAIVGQEGSRGRMGDSTATSQVTSKVVLLNNYISNGKFFTTKDKHHGNSLVAFHLGAVQRFEEVEKIIESVETPGKTWFIIQPFKEVDKEQDP